MKQVRAFIGLTGYYRRFIPNYALEAETIFKLTRKETPLNLDDSCQTSMDYLKNCLFFIHTDACDFGLGAALMQKDDLGRDVAVAFASKKLCTKLKGRARHPRRSVWE